MAAVPPYLPHKRSFEGLRPSSSLFPIRSNLSRLAYVYRVAGRSLRLPPACSLAVERAAHALAAAIEHMRIYHGRAHVCVAEQLLDRADVVAIFQQVGREAMPEGVAARGLCDPGALDRALDRPLEAVLRDMVAADLARARVGAALLGRKDILPAPVGRRIGVLARQRV
jgi:hypothetical protein